MVINGTVDAVGGVVAVVGDALDVFWKANDSNVVLLERHQLPGQRPSSGDYMFVILCGVVVIPDSTFVIRPSFPSSSPIGRRCSMWSQTGCRGARTFSTTPPRSACCSRIRF